MYADFTKNFREELETNILMRIQSKKINLKEKFKMERFRIVQLVEILRRVKPKEMIKLKYSTNFGVSVDTIEKIVKVLYNIPMKDFQRVLNELDNQNLLNLYLYIQYCDDLMHGKKIYEQKETISTRILKPFFNRFKELLEGDKDAQKHIQSSDDE